MSVPNHTIRVQISAAYTDGTYLFEDRKSVADTILRPIASSPNPHFQMIDLRLAIPKDQAEKFLNGLRSGNVSLFIESMKSELELAA